MVIDQLIEGIKSKKNPCIVGIDPEWSKIPECYKSDVVSEAETILQWAKDVIDAVADIVPAVKPQMAFFEVFGAEGVRVHQQVVQYAHDKGLVVVDDSKRNDIGNTARAYAYAHLAKDGPINADLMTVSPFLGTDSIQPFIDVAIKDGKGIFVLVKTSNPSSVEISEATNAHREKIRDWLASYVHTIGKTCVGKYGYSSIGAVVGAFMVFTVNPLQAVIFIVFLLILQQLEGNLIYPKVVGSSIGLPGMWVLAAVTVGGGVFGIGGMLLGVPLAASAYKLLEADVQMRISKKK